jgi:hypothetical protein
VKPVRHLMKSTLRTWCLVRIPKGESPGERSSKTCGDCLTEIWERQRRARARINRRNYARVARRRKAHRGVCAAIAEQMPCLVCSRWPVDVAHVSPIGSAGELEDKDTDNVVSLCRIHHEEQEGRTAAFEKKYGIKLRSIAKKIGRLSRLRARVLKLRGRGDSFTLRDAEREASLLAAELRIT